MPYEFLDDAPPADIGFRATGRTIDECFQAAADATLASMVANPEAIEAREHRRVRVEHEERELALARFLEELVFYKDAEGLLLRATRVRVRRNGAWSVAALLQGEPIDPRRHELTGDVKAVTMHRLEVEPTDAGWRATVVLDV